MESSRSDRQAGVEDQATRQCQQRGDTPELSRGGSPRPGGGPTPLVLALVAISIAVALSFALYADQIWEDFLISFRHSVNLVEGKGLTYQPGERIQGFSSPLAVLVGAAACTLAGPDPQGAIWLFRAVSLAAHGAALLFLLLACTARRAGERSWAVVVPGALYALESKTFAFATNGMETPFFLLFAAASLWTVARGLHGREPLLGALWGGMLWTRPDGSVYIALMGLAVLLFGSDRARSARLRSLLVAAGVCAVVYLPWFGFAWLYYGSPWPLAISAKQALGTALAHPDLASVWSSLTRLLPLIYLPPYAQAGNWSVFNLASSLVCAVATLYWLYPRGDLLSRQASFIAFGGLVYLLSIRQHWPWYLPIVFLFSLPVWEAVTESMARRCPRDRPLVRRTALGGGAAVLALFAFLATDYARVARQTTLINEQSHRRQIGLWLREVAEPDDSVFLECPGYIGFYSGLKMLDYPGVVSPEVVSFNNRGQPLMARTGLGLEPDWLVLRPHELQEFSRYDAPRLRAQYQVVEVFDRRQELSSALPDHPAALYDSTFIVLRRAPRRHTAR